MNTCTINADPARQLDDRLAMAAAYGLTSLTTVRMLIALYQHGPTTLSTLANAVGVSSASMTGNVDRLESRGLIRRERTSLDRRSIPVALTDYGLATVKSIAALP